MATLHFHGSVNGTLFAGGELVIARRAAEPLLGHLDELGRYYDLRGRNLATVAPNGDLWLAPCDDGPSPEVPRITISDAGSVRVDGVIELQSVENDPKLQVRGLTPATRRAAAFVIILSDVLSMRCMPRVQ